MISDKSCDFISPTINYVNKYNFRHWYRIGENSPPPGSAVYVGFDPTADSLHIGNLLAILSLLHFRRCGYEPIVVVRLFLKMSDFIFESLKKKKNRHLLHTHTVTQYTTPFTVQSITYIINCYRLEGQQA